jgi:dimethylargininase
VDEAAFAGVRLLDVPEESGANVLAIGETVLVAAAAPRTAALLRSLGRQVRLLDNSELMKAEGALTCCSLILQGWEGTDQEVCPTAIRLPF